VKQGLTDDGAGGHGPAAQAPEPWVARFAALVPAGGAVLDVACGGGRHGRLFAARGHPVTLLDRDRSGVADLAGRPGVEIVTADLEDGSPFPLAGRHFAAIVVVNYLHRPLFPVLIEALAPGGVLVWQTFARGNERFGKPSNPDFLLKPGELLAAVRGRLTVVAYEHGEVAAPRPAVIQRICAVADGEAPPRLP
jgi:SAM-dependent methyltransferase